MKPETKLTQITCQLIRARIYSKICLKLDSTEDPKLLYCTTEHHMHTLLFNASAESIALALMAILRREQDRHQAGTCPYCPKTENKE